MEKISTKLKKNDQVIVISGKHKSKTGRILSIDAEKGRVVVEGVNMVKKAIRKRKAEDRGGIMEVEAALHISNVALVDKSGKPVRAGYKFNKDQKVRVSVRSGEEL